MMCFGDNVADFARYELGVPVPPQLIAELNEVLCFKHDGLHMNFPKFNGVLDVHEGHINYNNDNNKIAYEWDGEAEGDWQINHTGIYRGIDEEWYMPDGTLESFDVKWSGDWNFSPEDMTHSENMNLDVSITDVDGNVHNMGGEMNFEANAEFDMESAALNFKISMVSEGFNKFHSDMYTPYSYPMSEDQLELNDYIRQFPSDTEFDVESTLSVEHAKCMESFDAIWSPYSSQADKKNALCSVDLNVNYSFGGDRSFNANAYLRVRNRVAGIMATCDMTKSSYYAYVRSESKAGKPVGFGQDLYYNVRAGDARGILSPRDIFKFANSQAGEPVVTFFGEKAFYKFIEPKIDGHVERYEEFAENINSARQFAVLVYWFDEIVENQSGNFIDFSDVVKASRVSFGNMDNDQVSGFFKMANSQVDSMLTHEYGPVQQGWPAMRRAVDDIVNCKDYDSYYNKL